MNEKSLQGIPLSGLKREILTFNSVLVETSTITANSTEFFEISESEEIVDSVSFTGGDNTITEKVRLISIHVNIDGASTDSDIAINESESGKPIHQVSEITQIDNNNTPVVFELSQGLGLPYRNNEDEESIYVRITENSNNDSKYQIKLKYVSFDDLARSIADISSPI
jgi:hypothetical protein